MLTLEANYPNPFTTRTEMIYELTESGYMSIRLIDISGKLVETITVNTFNSAGRHSITIDGSTLASGAYFVEMVFKDASGNLSREIQPVTVKR